MTTGLPVALEEASCMTGLLKGGPGPLSGFFVYSVMLICLPGFPIRNLAVFWANQMLLVRGMTGHLMSSAADHRKGRWAEAARGAGVSRSLVPVHLVYI